MPGEGFFYGVKIRKQHTQTFMLSIIINYIAEVVIEERYRKYSSETW